MFFVILKFGFLFINVMLEEKIKVGDLVALKDDAERSSGIGLVLQKDGKGKRSEDILDIISTLEESESNLSEIEWREQVPFSEPMVLVLWSSSKQRSMKKTFENNSVNFWIPISDVRVVSKA
jgi:hypothetical protein